MHAAGGDRQPLIHGFGLKRFLGKQKYKYYNENRLVNAAAMVLTFVYVAASFAVFANSYGKLGLIRNALFA